MTLLHNVPPDQCDDDGWWEDGLWHHRFVYGVVATGKGISFAVFGARAISLSEMESGEVEFQTGMMGVSSHSIINVFKVLLEWMPCPLNQCLHSSSALVIDSSSLLPTLPVALHLSMFDEREVGVQMPQDGGCGKMLL